MSQSIYQKWLNSKKISNLDKNVLRKYSSKEIATYFSDNHLCFGTAGIRAKMGMGTNLMNRYTYQQFTIGYAKYLCNKYPHNPTVIIGHDNRYHSDEFTKICANVLTSYGIKVYLFKNNHLIPTPIVSYLIREMNLTGGIIITASHNPKEYNGYKVYNHDGGQILPDVAKQIEKYMPPNHSILDIKITPNTKLIHEIDESYINHYFLAITKVLVNRDFLTTKKTYPVVVTTHHGTASNYLPSFIKQLKFNVYPVKQQCIVDPAFTNSPLPNPEDPKSFDAAIKLADQHNAKICLGVDPDADRLAIMIKHKNKWRMMSGNEMGIIYTYYLLNHRSYMNQPFVVSTHVSNNYIDRIAKDYNAKVFRGGTGFKWIGHYVSQYNGPMEFVVGFEEAIGALNTDVNRDKDSFAASLLTLSIYDECLKQKMDLVDYLEKVIYKKYGGWFGKTDSFIIPGLDWKIQANQIMDYYHHYAKKTVLMYHIKKISWNKAGDCLEWDLGNDNWIKFRMSGTEPKFKVYYNFYGNNLSILQKQYQQLHQFFKTYIEK